MKTLDIAMIAVSAALYAIVGILTSMGIIDPVFGVVKFWPAVVVPGIFAVLFGRWVGGIGAAIGIFISDVLAGHGNALLSFTIGCTSNFVGFYLIGLLSRKNMKWRDILILLFVGSVALTGMTGYLYSINQLTLNVVAMFLGVLYASVAIVIGFGLWKPEWKKLIHKIANSPAYKKETSSKIQRALDRANDIGAVFAMCKKRKIAELESIGIEVGKPIKVMLAQKAKNIADGFKQVGKPCSIEYKYDGFRMLIHKKGSTLSLFTRRLENVSKQFPEVVSYINKYVKGNSFILDSEAVGWDAKTKEYKPFQSVSQRIRRKYDIERLQKELPVEINVFDILYYNGKS